MNTNFNYVFSDFNLHNGNGYIKEKSAFYNWISNSLRGIVIDKNQIYRNRLFESDLSLNFWKYRVTSPGYIGIENSVTPLYEIVDSVNNLFLLECKRDLRDIFEFDLTDKIKNLLRNKQMKIIVSSLSEPTTLLNKFEKEFEKFCKQEEVSVDFFIFVDSNFNISKCNKIKGYYCPHLLINGGWDAKQILLGKDKSKNHLGYIPSLPTATEAYKRLDRDHYFISFNRGNNKLHRLILGCYFIEKNDDRILWSYLNEPEEDHGFEYLQTPNQKKLYSDNIEKLRDIVPKQIDTHDAKNLESFSVTRNYDKDKLSLNNYFDIVTESEFTHQSDSVIYISDKIVRPIVNLHPFIVVSTPGYLKHLRQLGFKTFDGLFDESYDDITDHSERLDFIMNEIDKILLKSPVEIKGLYEEWFETCVWNRNYLFYNMSLFQGSEFHELFYGSLRAKHSKASGIIPNEFPTTVIPTVGTSKISIAQFAKMGSTTLNKLAATVELDKARPRLKSAISNKRVIIISSGDRVIPLRGQDYDSDVIETFSYSEVFNSTIEYFDGTTNNGKVIVLLRDSLAKWKSGYYQESQMDFFKASWSGFQHLYDKFHWNDKDRTTDHSDLEELLIPNFGINSDLNWMAVNHAEFWSWCSSHHSYEEYHFSLLDLSKIPNVYFVELKDLSNPKFLKWLQSEDEKWKYISKIPHENNSRLRKDEFWKIHDFFWNYYHGNDLVNPFYDLPGNELNSDIKRWLKLVKSEQLVIDDIRKNHPRYKDFL